MLWLVSASGTNSFQSKSFRAPPAPELLSLCVLKEKVTKEKEHPAFAPCGHPARKVRVRATGFVDRASCPDDKLVRIHANHPSGFSSARPPLQRGPRQSSAHPARTLQKSQIKSESEATANRHFAVFQLHHRVRVGMAHTRCATASAVAKAVKPRTRNSDCERDFSMPPMSQFAKSGHQNGQLG